MTGVSAVMSGAAGFDSLDAGTAVAGASAVLSDYFASHEDAAQKISAALSPIIAVSEESSSVGGYDLSSKDMDETVYSTTVKGLAKVEGVLNVREAPSTLSGIIEYVIRGGEVEVIGERIVNGNLWYKIRYNGTEGYAAGNYLAFGEEAARLAKEIAKEESGEASLPELFEIPNDISWLSQDLQDQLNYYTREINFCISTNYPEETKKNNYVGMYSILLYLLENFQCIMDIANEYGLTDTYAAAAAALTKVDHSRVQLSAYTGSSEEQFIASITNTGAETQPEGQTWTQAPGTAAETAPLAAWTPETPAPVPETQPVWTPETQPVWTPETTAPAWTPETQPVWTPETTAPTWTPAPETPAPETPAPVPETPAPVPETPAPVPETPAPVPETPAPTQVASDLGSQIAAFAASWVGRINYVWGGNDFREGGGVDCSHFTYNVYLHFGLTSYYTTSGGQRGWGRPVDISQIQPGDLVCYAGHVAIYYGNGMIVHAPAPGRMIEIGSLYILPVVCVRRMY